MENVENNLMVDHSKDQHQHENHQELLDQEWSKSQENVFIKGIKAERSVANLIQQLPGFENAFKKGPEILNCLKCSDGRVGDDPSINFDEKLGLAGSGILFNSFENEKFVQENKGKIKVVTSHDECGAAALKYQEMLKNNEALPEGVTNSDELGKYFAKKEAELLGVEHRHIAKEDFACAVHNERMLVIDGTAKFNANNIPDFPPRFISASLGLGVKEDYVAKEAEILAGISLGDHGYGARFDSRNPFYIMVMAKSQQELIAMEHALISFVSNSSGKVQMFGLVVSMDKII